MSGLNNDNCNVIMHRFVYGKHDHNRLTLQIHPQMSIHPFPCTFMQFSNNIMWELIDAMPMNEGGQYAASSRYSNTNRK